VASVSSAVVSDFERFALKLPARKKKAAWLTLVGGIEIQCKALAMKGEEVLSEWGAGPGDTDSS